MDDLIQVANMALVKAIDRFDPERKDCPSRALRFRRSSARLKRYFRDHSWSVHVPRELQERAFKVNKAVEALSKQTGRSPLGEGDRDQARPGPRTGPRGARGGAGLRRDPRSRRRRAGVDGSSHANLATWWGEEEAGVRAGRIRRLDRSRGSPPCRSERAAFCTCDSSRT